MKLIKVGAAVLNQTPLAWDANKANIVRAIDEAKVAGVSLLCMPELCVTGYGCEDAFHAPGVLEMAWRVLNEILPATRGMVVCLGLPLVYQNGIFNTAAMIVDGEILGFVAKKYLAGDGIHYEPRWFKPWPAGVRTEVELDGRRYPLGDLGFDIAGVKIGFEICEDAWVAKRPGGDLATKGIDIILNPSASHFAFGKHEIRKRFVLEGSRAFSCSYVYANLLGLESGRVIYDGGTIIASGGKLLASGKRLSFDDVKLTTATIDLEVTRLSQWRSASFRPDLESPDNYMVRGHFEFPALSWLPESAENRPAGTMLEEGEGNALNAPVGAEWEQSADLKEEEFARAVSLGLYDYMRKSRSKGFVLSLSGGADSSAIAALIFLMTRLGTDELGAERYTRKLGYIAGLDDLTAPEVITGRLLTCVYQSTRNSGEVTRNAAHGVAEAIGAEYHEFDVEPLVQGYIEMVSKSIGRPLSWETDDIALQNIQARVRAPGVWMMANLKGALLLTTSNRSEAAVGYATMDGDTAGGLCPIGGIDKAFLRHWLRWMEHEGPVGIGRMPVLRLVNEQQPTAELRPAGSHQTDESDLMPYEVLDPIERAAIRDKKMPLEVFWIMRAQFGDRYSVEQLALWVERFYRLWCINQWKRERYAPSFHLDDENLDPKTWCRFPILSGGFQRELEALRQAVKELSDKPARRS